MTTKQTLNTKDDSLQGTLNFEEDTPIQKKKRTTKPKPLKVIELFAGVGGFRVGLDRAAANVGQPGYFSTIWSNQFEPATTRQHASEVYVKNFGAEGHVNKDINLVPVEEIPNHDILVGGFPCQDYSVARTLSQSAGIEGKKGVLWWNIEKIVREKGKDAPSILFLENVDRLTQSPAKQRGRDFAIILESLNKLGYIVEWRIVTADDYGFPQRRRRTYILAYKSGSKIYKQITDPIKWLYQDGVFAKAFPVKQPENCAVVANELIPSGEEEEPLLRITKHFNENNKLHPFATAGVMMNGQFWTVKVEPDYHGPYTTLGDILLKEGEEHRNEVTEEYYIHDEDRPAWEREKGAKKIVRKSKEGFEYIFSEGGMSFPDNLERASRTIITGEGGAGASRFKHVVEDPVTHKLRRLVPVELERLDMFPDGHTAGPGITDGRRAFFMGNALVCGIVTGVGEELYKRMK